MNGGDVMLALVGLAGLLAVTCAVAWTVFTGELEWFASGRPKPAAPEPADLPITEPPAQGSRPLTCDELRLKLQVTPSDFHRPRRTLS
jgi:hypothetical protein